MYRLRVITFFKIFTVFTSLILGSWSFGISSEKFDPGRLTVTTVYDQLDQPMELEVAEDGRIFFIELNGEFRVFLPDTEEAILIYKFDVARRGEVGLIGLALIRILQITAGFTYNILLLE